MAAPKFRRRNAQKLSVREIEALEPRIVFSTITVNTLSDNTTSDNFMSLHEAVELMDAAGNAGTALGRSLTSAELAQIDTTDAFGTNNRIVFAAGITGGTINVLSTYDISGTMTIDAGDDGITLDGGGSSSTYRAFSVFTGANLTIDGLTVTDFRAEDAGGGLWIQTGGSVTILNSAISGNTTFGTTASFGDPGQGGAIYAQGTLTVDQTTFSGNSATGGNGVGMGMTFGGLGQGGAIYLSGTATITSSLFVNNTATGGTASFSSQGQGGAIASGGGTLSVTNSTFTQNTTAGSAGVAGGIFASGGGSVTLNFVTMSSNVGTLARNLETYVNLTVTNTIIGQSNNSVVDVRAYGTNSGSNNLIRNMGPGSNMGITSTANPQLGALADNGGPTQTMKLQSGSAAIDAAVATVLTTDQRGRTRVVGTAADLGAYETNPAPTVSNATSTTFVVGQAGTFTFTTATDGSTPTLNQTGALPAGVTFTDNADGTATLAGTPSTSGVFSLSITAANGTSPDDVQTFTLTVNRAPGITSANAASFTQDAAGTFTVTTTGDPNAALSITAGTLPTGVTFTDNGDGTATLAGTPGAAGVGDHVITITADNNVSPDATQTFTLTVAAAVKTVVTAGGGTGGSIVINNPDGTEKLSIDNPFPASSTPRRIATADSGDVVVGSGASTAAKVYVYDGTTGSEVTAIDPFGTYKGGVFVATGDVNNDGTDDIIVSAGKRAATYASIKVYDGATYGLIADIWAFNEGQSIRLASADLDGDGYAEVVATRGNKVRVFGGQALSANTATIASEFTPFAGYTGGVFVATGDIDDDNQADIIVSQAEGNRPWIAVFNGDDNTLQKKYRVTAFNGTPIAARDFNNDGHDDILAVVKNGQKNAVRVFSGMDDSILSTVDADEKGRLFIA